MTEWLSPCGTVRLICGDCLDVLPTLEPGSVDAVVTDPPYGLSFMGKHWDHGIPGEQFWREVFRVAKPGCHLLAFGGTRTYHRLAVAIEDAGWEVRDCLGWIYGSGFPKSLDVSKAIDRVNGEADRLHRFTAWMRTTGMSAKQINDATGTFMGSHYLTDKSQPAIPTPELWEILRPMCGDVPPWVDELVDRIAAEREVVAKVEMTDTRKARAGFSGSTHSPDYDGSRRLVSITAPATDAAKQWHGWGTALKPAWEPIILARKPLIGTVAANVLEHGTGGLNVDGCRVGDDAGWSYPNGRGGSGWHGRESLSLNLEQPMFATAGRWPANIVHDGSGEVLDVLGEQSRFFYSAKASKADRDDENYHPTVKPTDLMRWLVRLITPPGGTVLDPFMGSGSTGKASWLEDFRFVGIERENEYFEIAKRRTVESPDKRPLFEKPPAPQQTRQLFDLTPETDHA